MRNIAGRELPVPDMDILYVEQEIVGDDTIAVNSVLEADIERAELLKEEQEILALQKDGEKVPEEKEIRLAEVYATLAEIEGDKAPAL